MATVSARGKPASGKLGQTLHELESAFADWEKLSDEAPKAARPIRETSTTDRKDLDLRKKTKMLLDQLREQLEALEK